MRKFLVYCLLIGLLAVGVFWWNFDRLVQQAIRPWLAAKIGQAMQAEVSIGALTFDTQHLLVSRLRLVDQAGLDLLVTEIKVRFSIRNLLRKRLDEVLVRQPAVQFEPAGFERDQPVADDGLPAIAPFFIDRWLVEAGALHLILPDRELELHGIAAHGSLGTDFTFATQALFGAKPAVGFGIGGTGQWRQGLAITLSELTWDGQELLPEAVTFSSAGLSDAGLQLALAELESAAVGVLLKAAGATVPWPPGVSWQIAEPNLVVQWSPTQITFHLTAQNGLVAAGESHWPWRRIELQAAGLADAWQLSAALDLAGASRLQMTGQWQQQSLRGEGRFSAGRPAELARQLRFGLPAAGDRLRQLAVQSHFQVTADKLELQQGTFEVQIDEVGLLRGRFRAQKQGQGVTATLDRPSLTAADGTLLAEAGLSLSGNLATGNWQGKWSLASSEPSLLANQTEFALPAEFPRLSKLALAGALSWRDRRLTLTEVSMQGVLNGGGLSAALRGQLNIDVGAGETELALQNISLVGIEYANADGSMVGVGGNLTVAGNVRLDERQGDFKLHGRATVSEALLGSWYGELSTLPVNFSGQGRWEIAGENLHLDDVQCDLAGLAIVRVQGDLSTDAAQLRGSLAVDQLAGDFEKTVQRLAADLVPGIGQLSLAGGVSAEAVLDMQASDWSVKLLLQPQDVALAWGDALQFTGLRGRFPVLLRHGDSLPAAGVVTGTLHWDRLVTKLLAATHGTVQMEASANRWRLTAPLQISSAEGTIHLKQLLVTTRELQPRALASLEISDLQMARLAETLGWPEMRGQLNAALDDIQFSQEEIVTTGRAVAEVFGGVFQLHNLRMEKPLSRFPTYHAEIDFEGLDLYALTQTFEFGEINGIADGYVRNLRLFDRVPSAFEASFETRTSGTRNISVKAIRNLNTLSQGGLSAALSQGIYQFIDFYRYRKMGFLCTLRNDQFHVIGLARADTDQYLVDGGLLPPKIDVIMSSPTISFREMVQRLKRIERADH